MKAPLIHVGVLGNSFLRIILSVALLVGAGPAAFSQVSSLRPTTRAERSVIAPGEVGETGVISLRQTSKQDWIQLNFERSYSDPVVLLSIQTAKGLESMIARARNVTSSGCEVRLEWAKNTQGIRREEDLAYLVIEAGRHVLLDGTVIDAGTKRVGQDWEVVRFLRPLPSNARVVCQAVSAQNSHRIIIPRIRGVDRDGFSARIDSDESRGLVPLKAERVSWVAVSRAFCITDSSVIRAGGTTRKVNEQAHRVGFSRSGEEAPMFFVTVASNEGRDPVIARIRSVRPYDAWFSLQEDSSSDAETSHREENVHWLAVSPGVISTVQSDSDGDLLPDAYERKFLGGLASGADDDPDGDGLSNRDEIRLGLSPTRFDARPLIMSWTRPINQDRRDRWARVSFNDQIFSDPVVVACVQSSLDATLVIPRIRGMNSLGFELQLEESESDDGVHESARVGLLAVEAGRHALPGGGFIEAGRTNVWDSRWKKVTFQGSFGETPVVLVQVVTERNRTPVLVRVRNVKPESFLLSLQEEEALRSQEHGAEMVAWIAVSPGVAETLEGTFTAERLPTRLDHNVVEIEVDPAYRSGTEHRPNSGIFFGQLQSSFDEDTANLGMYVSKDSVISMWVDEETSADVELAHGKEIVGLLSMPNGVLAFYPCSVDQDGDGLADSLEVASGLNPTVRRAADKSEGYFGDSDGDGIPNGVEARRGLPLDHPGGIIEWEVFTDIPGRVISRLGRSSKFVAGRSQIYQIPTLETPRFFADNYGSRIRGYLIPPRSGRYTFFLTGDNETRLFLSSDDSPFGKEPICRVRPGAQASDPNAWFKAPEHVSEPVYLQAGTPYYMEVIQKDDIMDDFLQVGWMRPGHREVKVIPAKYWVRYRPIAADADDDSLPDRWERRTGLDSANVLGAQSRDQAEYGDPDGDGLTNFDEWRYGTNPLGADSDGDGIDDGREINEFNTNPLLPPESLTQIGEAIPFPELTAFASAQGVWTQTPTGAVTSSQRQSRLTYNFTTPRDGIWIYEIGARLNGPPSRSIPISVKVDGAALREHIVRHPIGETYTADGRTMFLQAGEHQLEIINENVAVDIALEILSVEIFAPGGLDSDGDGIPNWLQDLLANANGIDGQPSSLVSPACLEGLGEFPAQLTLGLEGGDPIEVFEGTQGRWFANVPLHADQLTHVNASFESAAVSESTQIAWEQTVITAHRGMILRVGDTLKLVPGPAATQPGKGVPVSLKIVSKPGDELVSEHSLQDQAYVARTFETKGRYQIQVHTSTGDVTAGMHIQVVAPDFGPATIAVVGSLNHWPIPRVPWALAADPDPVMKYIDYQGNTPRRAAWVDPGRSGPVHVLARTSPGGPIAAVGRVNGIEIANVNETHDNRAVETFENGDRLVESSFVVSGEFPEGWYVEIRIKASGVSFADGTRIRRFYSGSFDEFGVATMQMYLPHDAPTKNCHYMLLYNAKGQLVSNF